MNKPIVRHDPILTVCVDEDDYLHPEFVTVALAGMYNAVMETYALSLWWDGMETNHDGELVQVHTGYAMGADDA